MKTKVFVVELDDGRTVPRCVEVCPTGAIQFGDVSGFAAEIASATQLGPVNETKSRGYYWNMPGRFVAGPPYDPVEKEIAKGALCTLVDEQSGEKREAASGGFGDLWFVNLPERTFALTIEAEAFVPEAYAALDASTDVNLSEIALTRSSPQGSARASWSGEMTERLDHPIVRRS